MSREACTVIVNPHACSGKVGRTWPSLAGLVAGLPYDVTIEFTQAKGHATAICQQALRRGAQRILAVGGDGTTNEVLAGFFDEQGNNRFAHACLGMIAHGSGSDFRRLLGPMAPFEQAKALYDSPVHTIDCGLVRFRERSDAPGNRARTLTRPFLNVASIGISGLVDRLVEDAPRTLGARLTYLQAALRAILKYEAKVVALSLDDQVPREIALTLLALGNGQYFGAGMWICPNAAINDGRLDAIILPSTSKFGLIGLLAKVFSGRHLRDPRVQSLRVRKVEITTQLPLWIDLDGEAVGTLPATIEVAPLALRLWAPLAPTSTALAEPVGQPRPTDRTNRAAALPTF